MRKLFAFVKICHVLTFLLLFSLPANSSTASLKVSLSADSLSLTAVKVPLQKILLEIARTGVNVRIDPRINPVKTVNFSNRPLDEALDILLNPASYSLIWESRSEDADTFKLKLAEIQVFQSERKSLMKPLTPVKVQEIARNSEGTLYVKGEILLYLNSPEDLLKLKQWVEKYNGFLDFEGSLPGPARVLLPSDSDVFAISSKLRRELNLPITQPNYAHPLNPPVYLRSDAGFLPQTVSTVTYGSVGNKAAVAILDSGLAENSDLTPLVLSSLDAVNPDLSITDSLGHGTQMAYIASGIINPYGSDSEVASTVPIIPVRSFDDSGYTTDYGIMTSVNFALENNAKVMSLSWGSETKSSFMEKAFDNAHKKGLIIVASAGNEPTGKPVYPAAYSSVIGVGALEPHGTTWDKSNYGNFVMLYAPGFANMPVGHKGEPGVYAGTSIATAHVANAIATFLTENPSATMQDVNEFLKSNY